MVIDAQEVGLGAEVAGDALALVVRVDIVQNGHADDVAGAEALAARQDAAVVEDLPAARVLADDVDGLHAGGVSMRRERREVGRR